MYRTEFQNLPPGQFEVITVRQYWEYGSILILWSRLWPGEESVYIVYSKITKLIQGMTWWSHIHIIYNVMFRNISDELAMLLETLQFLETYIMQNSFFLTSNKWNTVTNFPAELSRQKVSQIVAELHNQISRQFEVCKIAVVGYRVINLYCYKCSS